MNVRARDVHCAPFFGNKQWLCMLTQSFKQGSVKWHPLIDHIVLSCFVLIDAILQVLSPCLYFLFIFQASAQVSSSLSYSSLTPRLG